MEKLLNVLQVEDNPVDAELVIRQLQRAGFVVQARRVETEEAFVAALGESVDVVLSDYEMPQFSGLRALAILRASAKAEVPFILISGTIGEDQAVESMRQGASDYLLKDRLGRLGQAVSAALTEMRLKQERADAVEALRVSEERFREMADNIDEVFWMTDPENTRVHYVNSAYEKTWGRSREGLSHCPRGWLENIHPEDRARIEEAKKTRQAEGSFHETYRIIRPDGVVRWIRDKAYPIRDGAGKVVRIVGVAEDITDRQKMEEHLRQTQKMEAIGTLAGGVAHDFNNILGAISGFNELIKMNAALDAETAENTDAISKAVRRAADLVKQIMAFSRSQEQQRRPMQLRHVVAESMKLLRASVPATIELDVRLRSDVSAVSADPTQVHQVVMNLVTNAWHAIGEAPGRIHVSLSNCVVGAQQAVQNPDLRPGRYALLEVTDNGSGMDEPTMARIFEPFFTTKPVGKGTGLGLAVVHGIVKSHEAAITVDSRLGAGTTFHLYFPSCETEVTSAGAGESVRPTGTGETILIVDDEVAFVTVARKALTRLGYTVQGVSDALEGMSIFRAAPERFDLLIVDQTMPRMTGVEFARCCRNLRPDLPVLLITGYTASLTPERIRELGIRDILLKPVAIDALAMAVHEAVDSRTKLVS